MDNGGGIDFGDALEDSGFEFLPGVNSDMPQRGACHFAEERFNDIEPRAVRGRQDVLKAVGILSQKRPRLFGNRCGVIVQYDPDRAFEADTRH